MSSGQPKKTEGKKEKEKMRGRGLVEFISCKEEILNFLAEGGSVSEVHRILSSQGKVTTKLKNFHRILARRDLKKRPIVSLEEELLPSEHQKTSESPLKTEQKTPIPPKSQPPKSSPALSGSPNGRTIIMKKNHTNRYTKE